MPNNSAVVKMVLPNKGIEEMGISFICNNKITYDKRKGI